MRPANASSASGAGGSKAGPTGDRAPSRIAAATAEQHFHRWGDVGVLFVDTRGALVLPDGTQAPDSPIVMRHVDITYYMFVELDVLRCVEPRVQQAGPLPSDAAPLMAPSPSVKREV